MFNSEKIESFIKRVNKEAEASAQLVFDKYEAEFKELVISELPANIELHLSMGSGYYNGKIKKSQSIISEHLLEEVAIIQYLKQEAAFKTTDFKSTNKP